MRTDSLPILSSPDIMGGTPVFAGTRVPVQTFVEYLEAGDPLDEFLVDFPSVSREQAIAVLELAKRLLLAQMRAAGFTTLVTVDRNLTFQQHIAASGIAVIVVHALTNRLPDLLPLAPQVVAAIAETPAGAIARVGV